MKLYELINPSDPYTFYAPSILVAGIAAAFLSTAFGAVSCDGDDYNIEDWAVNNMNWSDFDGHQVKLNSISGYSPLDFEEAWLERDKGYSNGDKL